MCQEVFQIAMGMDLKSVEMQLAIQCAPLITGARISNMLMIDSADESAMRVILRASGISHFRLAARNEKTAFLLFNRKRDTQRNPHKGDNFYYAGSRDKSLLRFGGHRRGDGRKDRQGLSGPAGRRSRGYGGAGRQNGR